MEGHFYSLYHFLALHRHLHIRLAIIAESLPLHIVSDRTRERKLLITYLLKIIKAIINLLCSYTKAVYLYRIHLSFRIYAGNQAKFSKEFPNKDKLNIYLDISKGTLYIFDSCDSS